jgi:hypothetical protein
MLIGCVVHVNILSILFASTEAPFFGLIWKPRSARNAAYVKPADMPIALVVSLLACVYSFEFRLVPLSSRVARALGRGLGLALYQPRRHLRISAAYCSASKPKRADIMIEYRR